MKEYKNPICRGSWALGNNCRTCDKCIDTKPKTEIISIEDEDGKVYEFEKPKFECELLKVINNDGIATDRIVGIVQHNRYKNEFVAHTWWVDGISMENRKDLCLTPIKSKWFEDEANFPALVYSENSKSFHVKLFDDIDNDYYRLATKAERDSLYCEGE